MKTTVLTADRLTPAHLEAWSRWQRADPALDSPFFRPEFMRAVAEVRHDVEVAMLEEGGEPAGFFPFQRGGWGLGRPVGGRLCDFQGVVTRPGLAWRADELVRGCGLRAWDFDHVVAAQASFHPYRLGGGDSPFMDLSEGFEAYLAGRARAGSMLQRQVRRKARKLEREVGLLRFEFHTAAPEVLQALIAWKSDQYRRTGATDVFAFPWTTRLLGRLLGGTDEAFSGVLSALYAGRRLAAAHFGLQSLDVLHWWFPTYDPAFGAYSPGLILLAELAREGAGRGVRRIDLGKGDADYKTSFMTGATPLAEGCVTAHPLARLLRLGWRRTRSLARSSPLGAPARVAGRWTRSLRGWLAFR